MTWQDDYYLGSSDYPATGADDDIDPDGFFELGLARGGHLADDLASVLLSDDPALD